MMGLPVSGSDQSALSTQQLAGVSSGTEAAIAAMARSMMGGGWGSQVTTAAGAATAASLHAQQHAQPPAAALYQQQQQYLQQQQAALSAMRGPGIGGGAARANKVRCICSVPIERGRMAMCQVRAVLDLLAVAGCSRDLGPVGFNGWLKGPAALVWAPSAGGR
jgi:hypothetical protein